MEATLLLLLLQLLLLQLVRAGHVLATSNELVRRLLVLLGHHVHLFQLSRSLLGELHVLSRRQFASLLQEGSLLGRKGVPEEGVKALDGAHMVLLLSWLLMAAD